MGAAGGPPAPPRRTRRKARGPRDGERAQIGAQARERAFIEKAGQIVRGVGKQLAASYTDEEVEEFARDLFGIRIMCGLRKRRVGETERRRIAAKLGKAFE